MSKYDKIAKEEFDNPCPCLTCELKEECADWLLACKDYAKYFDKGISQKTDRQPTHSIYTRIFGLKDRDTFLKNSYSDLIKLLTNHKNVVKFMSGKWRMKVTTVQTIILKKRYE